MITSDFISILRRKYNDVPKQHEDIRTGDGTSTSYQSKYMPILEGSNRLYINNSLKTEGVSGDYTLDKDTGDIALATTTSSEIKLRYKSVNFRDQHWLEALQSAFKSLGDQFFTTEIRQPVRLTAGVSVVPMPSGCIRVTEALEGATSAGPWARIKTNVRYDRRSNKLVLGNNPTTSNYLAISYQKRLTPPSATSATFDCEETWEELIDLKAGSIYLDSMANRIAQQGSATIEEGHLSIGGLRQLANDKKIEFENLKKKLKPVMPNSEIPFFIPTGGSV